MESAAVTFRRTTRRLTLRRTMIDVSRQARPLKSGLTQQRAQLVGCLRRLAGAGPHADSRQIGLRRAHRARRVFVPHLARDLGELLAIGKARNIDIVELAPAAV